MFRNTIVNFCRDSFAVSELALCGFFHKTLLYILVPINKAGRLSFEQFEL